MVAAGLALAAALSFALSIRAQAAIEAGLSTPIAHAGVRVTLTTRDYGNLTAYGDLVTYGPDPVYIVSTTDFEKRSRDLVARDAARLNSTTLES